MYCFRVAILSELLAATGAADCCPENHFGDSGCYCLTPAPNADPRCGGPIPSPSVEGGICKVDKQPGLLKTIVYKAGYTDDDSFTCCPNGTEYVGGSTTQRQHKWYCNNLVSGNKCAYDDQCISHKCNNNICLEQKKPLEGDICYFEDGHSNIYGYTDDSNLQCCTAQYIADNFDNIHDWYCMNLNKNDKCKYAWQCRNNICTNNVCQ